jgi:hypothetical protein
MLMEGMKSFSVTIEGRTPLLMNNPAQSIIYGQKVRTRQLPPPEEAAERAAYRLPDGRLYVQAIAIREAILSGAIGYKAGRVALWKILSGAMFIEPELIPLSSTPDGNMSIHDYAIDMRRAVNPSNKAGIITVRARVDLPWIARFTICYDDLFVEPGPILLALNRAGRVIGICDYRPETGGWFGTFKVIEPSSDNV